MRLYPLYHSFRTLRDAAPRRAGWNVIAACGALLVLTSCINSQNTRFPTLYSGGAEYERNQAAIQDPYPDSIAGPDAGFRPNDFAQERPEPTRANARHVAAQMRQQYQQQNGGGQQPLFAPSTMAPAPAVTTPAPVVGPPVAMVVPPYPPYPPYPPPPPPYGYPAVVPIGPAAPGPYWMPYSPPVVVRPFLPRISLNFVIPFD